MTIDTERGALGQDFLHGYASAAYQIEGGYDKGGRGLSVWDEALVGKDNGNEGCASFDRWREDVDLLRLYGANTYRFSISWSRVIPLGGRHDPVNRAGLDYYSTLVRNVLRRKAYVRSILWSRQTSRQWSHYFTGMYQPE
jgi:beta-glucosidase